MKYVSFVLFSFLALVVNAQSYMMNLYFEDSKGAIDTLVFGFDEQATPQIDQELNEHNLINELDSILPFAFFTDAVTMEGDSHDPYLEQEKLPTFISKSQIVGSNQYAIEIGIVSNSWPITISWDSTVVEQVIQFFGETERHLILICFNPPGGWFDGHACGGFWIDDKYYVELPERSSIVVNKDDFCTYRIPEFQDTIRLLYVGILASTAVKYFENDDYFIRYDNTSHSISIKSNTRSNDTAQLKLYNLSGKMVFEKDVCIFNGGQNVILLPHIVRGDYILILTENDKLKFNKKIFIP